MAAGRRAGVAIAPEQAIEWITRNPARMLGLADQTGTLESGKRADVVIWSADPFSIYAHADQVFVDGASLTTVPIPRGSLGRIWNSVNRVSGRP